MKENKVSRKNYLEMRKKFIHRHNEKKFLQKKLFGENLENFFWLGNYTKKNYNIRQQSATQEIHKKNMIAGTHAPNNQNEQ